MYSRLSRLKKYLENNKIYPEYIELKNIPELPLQDVLNFLKTISKTRNNSSCYTGNQMFNDEVITPIKGGKKMKKKKTMMKKRRKARTKTFKLKSK